MKLVPYSPSIFNTAVEGKDKTPKCRYIQIKIRLKKTFTVTFGHGVIATVQPVPKKQLVVPYWLLGATGDKDRANMAMSTIKCTMNCQVGKHEAAEESVLVPILQNTKCIKENEELLVFKDSLLETVVSIDPTPSKKRSFGRTTKRRCPEPKKKARKAR